MSLEVNQEIAKALATQKVHEEVFYQSAEFWVAMAFCLVMAALLKPLLKAGKNLITKRIIRIKRELQEAENLKLEAQKLYAEYERKFINTDKEVADIVKEQENAIEEIKEKKEREMNLYLQRKSSEVDSRIEQELEQVEEEINHLISDKTATILTEVISSKLTKSDYNHLIDKSIGQIKEGLSAQK